MVFKFSNWEVLDNLYCSGLGTPSVVKFNRSNMMTFVMKYLQIIRKVFG